MTCVTHHSVDPAPNVARATLRLRFGGLLGGVMGRKMADLRRAEVRQRRRHPRANRSAGPVACRGNAPNIALIIRMAPTSSNRGLISMAGNKTKPTDASVDDYIASRANAQQEADCRELMAMFRKITRQKEPRMWGPSIVGYDNYKYTNSSGRPAEVPLACFAIRGRDLVVYLYAEGPRQRALRSKLGKHKMGKSCLYFRRLADLDKSVLQKLVVGSIEEFKSSHA